MSKRKTRLLVSDILEAIEKIRTYIEAMKYEDFANDVKTIDAVVRNLEIIGKASRQLPEELTRAHPNIP